MCDPVSIVMGLVAVVGGLVSYDASKDAAAKQEQAIEDGLAKDREATAEMYKQINKTAMDDQAQLHTKYLIDSARIAAMQGESGMLGATYDRIEAEAENNADTDMATLENNRLNQVTQGRTQSVAQASRAGIQKAGISQPSKVGTALQIAGETAKAYLRPIPDGLPAAKPPTTKGDV